MILSNRLWRAIAYRMGDNPADAMVWAKVESEAKGKRHFLRRIMLTFPEMQMVLALLRSPCDDYMRFVIAHERATNPGFPA